MEELIQRIRTALNNSNKVLLEVEKRLIDQAVDKRAAWIVYRVLDWLKQKQKIADMEAATERSHKIDIQGEKDRLKEIEKDVERVLKGDWKGVDLW